MTLYTDPTGNLGIDTTSPGAVVDIVSTDAIRVPVGTTGNRPGTPLQGMLRYNTTTSSLDLYDSSWSSVGVTAFTGFKATQLSVQTFTSAATYYKVSYETEVYDPQSDYDPTTNYRYTPSTEGYYSFNMSLAVSNSPSSNSYLYIYLRKNGTDVYGCGGPSASAGSRIESGKTIEYMNGSTDYVEIWVYQGYATKNTSVTSALHSEFSGTFIGT
ncbi:MAG: hypothetical protein QNK36_10480 [Colwellia sp.]|nr:hypothetical protein [Colwellia sp.]